MVLNLKCPSCGQLQQVSDEAVGQKLTCPSCGTGFRVSAPKPKAAPNPEPASYSLQPPEPAVQDAPPRPAPSPVRPVAARGADPSPRPKEPVPAASPRRGALPAWAYGILGGAAVGAVAAGLIGIVLAGRTLLGSGSTRYPDPAADIALGVASHSGSPIAPTLAAPAPNLAAPVSTVAAPAPSVAAPTVRTVATSSGPIPSDPARAATPAPAMPPPAATPAPATRNAPLTTAEIVRRWEPSVALVKAPASSGTGFVVRPGIIATNSHVIDGEFISALEVRFPSAPEGRQGPFPAELLFEDPKRDVAFLSVPSDLPAVEIAPSYAFLKGEDVTVIGNPGLSEDVVLENAISRGVMSSRTVIEGMNFLQMSIAINPGNSGGPVFDSSGRVIGVATLKSSKAESMGFCIPVEDLQAAIGKLGTSHPDHISRHRADTAFKTLTAAGALYGLGLEIRAGLLRKAAIGQAPNPQAKEQIQKFDETLTALDEKLFSLIEGEIPGIQSDTALAQGTRARYRDLAARYNAMKDLYTNAKPPADQYTSKVQALRTQYVRLVESLQKELKIDIPAQLLAILKLRAIDDQSHALVAQIVPDRVQSRVLRSHGRLSQRGPNGARGPAQTPAQAARERMQNARDRMRARRNN